MLVKISPLETLPLCIRADVLYDAQSIFYFPFTYLLVYFLIAGEPVHTTSKGMSYHNKINFVSVHVYSYPLLVKIKYHYAL